MALMSHVLKVQHEKLKKNSKETETKRGLRFMFNWHPEIIFNETLEGILDNISVNSEILNIC